MTECPTRARPVESLKPADFLKHRVWEFVSHDEPKEMYVNPVQRLPVGSLESRIIGVEVQLANGRPVWALLGNVDVRDARRIRQCARRTFLYLIGVQVKALQTLPGAVPAS